MDDAAGAWAAFMREAIALAQSAEAPRGVNPRVGCVIVSADGTAVGRGFHRGAGTAHAEVAALADAGDRARGATAVVTLEPCRHVGRTGPCTSALIKAGISRVVFAQADPTAEAGGGAGVLAAAGIEVLGGVLSADAAAVNLPWAFHAAHGRPLVTWKCAVSLDGRVAGADGGPTEITGEPARAAVHLLRAEVDAIIVGTGTVLADDPLLTVRGVPIAAGAGPLRVVVGAREIPREARVRDASAPTLFVADRDPASVLAVLGGQGVRHALLEGGPTLAAAFLAAAMIDRIDWFVAPVLLGAGPVALAEPLGRGPAGSPAGRPGVAVESVSVVGEDVRVVGTITYAPREG
ncbi:MAG: bifunctional diaminohydroxyphosphoribosylaminopyrimidine deaminase/5-amino-6-(5-phosphoribosylamino)uracil reductase RibD [Actinomycetota bacterium]|nr:bifunctional diaminohydroxyphosphoribosylaminopyrimidine deaminase/5-amino-6-(5-phosphoribosylamino)uracil reductase RibD [Actinomycetota bacterium]